MKGDGPNTQRLAEYATIIGLFVAILGVVFAYLQYRTSAPSMAPGLPSSPNAAEHLVNSHIELTPPPKLANTEVTASSLTVVGTKAKEAATNPKRPADVVTN
jgi:hypothetical protein